jgi:hypothetical protein
MFHRHSGLNGLFLLISAAIAGCGSRDASKPAAMPGASGAVAAKASPESGEKTSDSAKGAINDWPVPAASLLVSGEQNGYLEPCGCTSGQLGGLIRRHELHRRLTSQGWNVVPVDLGGLIKDPGSAMGGLEQTKIKFTVALRALKAMNYQAIALSAADLKLGTLEVLGQYLNLGDSPKILAANVKPTAGFEQTILPSFVANAGEKKIGVTAVIDPESLKQINDPTFSDLLTISPPAEALKPIAASLESSSDWQVLLVQGPPEMAKTLAEAFPAFDVVVATSVYEDPKADADEVNGGKTLIVNVGKKGKYNGLVGFFPDTDKPIRYQRVTLGTKFDGPGAGEPIRKLIDEDFQAELKQAGVVENFPRRSHLSAVPGATFVGAGACKSCHPNTYAKWLTSKHAHAYEPLTSPKRNREFDAECITCHTTGFEYESGWVSAEKTPYLMGNQCENCHGPASMHVGDPTNGKFRQAMALTSELADKNMLCVRCHDADNSPKFNFGTFWPQIMHKGLDKYDNPRVNKGLNDEEVARLRKSLLADQAPKDKRVQQTAY